MVGAERTSMPRGAQAIAVVFAALIVVSGAGCGGAAKSGSPQAAPTTTPQATTTASPGQGMTFTRANYAELVSDPNSYKGAQVVIVGKVFDVQQDAKGTYFQMWADPKNDNWNTLVAVADPTLQLKEGDYVRVAGAVKQNYTGKNAFGAEVSAPVIVASGVTPTTALAAASPAIATDGRASYTVSGITTTVRKVEFAADETRVYVTVVNNSDAPFNLYTSSVRAVSGGVQVDSTYTGDGYPELADSIDSGARSSGVIVFDHMDPSAPLKLTFEGYSEDSNIGDYGSVKFWFTWQ